MAMNVQSKNCYDVFNDYLGLSNVVGGQDESCYWMESVLGCDSGSCHKARAVSKQEYRFSNSKRGYMGQESSLSDVERLFGRGAVLHKAAQANSYVDMSSPISVEAQRRSKNPTPTRMLNSSPVCQMNYREEANDYKDSIQLALDAILRKYDCLQQPHLQPIQLNDKDIGVKYTSNRHESRVFNQQGADLHEVHSPTTSDEGDNFFRDGGYLGSKTSFHGPATRFVGCSFCKNNKEVREWYMSHQLKDTMGRVTCPVLRSYECPLCDATGDNAHTVGHCPLNPNRHNSLPLAVRTKANATGKKKPA